MNKKSLFLLFLLGTCSCQALWELPAAFLMGMAARTSLGKRATSFVFSTCKKALLCRGLNCNVEISSIINPSGKSSGLAYFGNATKAMAIKSRASISSCMVACMTRVKEMQKKNFADQDIPQPASDFRRVQYVYTQQEAKAAQQDQAVEKDQNSTQFIKADAQIDARVINQNVFGLFGPRIINSNGASFEELMRQYGKTERWKGIAIGGFTMGTTMAWLHNKAEHKA